MTIEERLRQAEEQLAYWTQQREYAERQWWMWQGAVEALRGVTSDERRVTSAEVGAEEESAIRGDADV